MPKCARKSKFLLEARNDRISELLRKIKDCAGQGSTSAHLLKDSKAAFAALQKHWKLVHWLASKKPVLLKEREAGGCHVWACGVCRGIVATYLTLDVHVCKAVSVPAELVPVVQGPAGHSCGLCSQRVTPGAVHECKSLFLCTALYDFGGRVCNEGRLARVTEVATAAAAHPGLHDKCAQLRRLNARVVAVVDVPGVLADVPDVAAATAAAQEPLVTVAWIAESQLAVSTQGLYLLSGRHLVYWGPRAPSRARERLAGDGAAAFSDMQWMRRLCADKDVVGSFGGLIVRGFPFGGAAAMVNHKCAPTACVEHVLARRPAAKHHEEGQPQEQEQLQSGEAKGKQEEEQLQLGEAKGKQGEEQLQLGEAKGKQEEEQLQLGEAKGKQEEEQLPQTEPQPQQPRRGLRLGEGRRQAQERGKGQQQQRRRQQQQQQQQKLQPEEPEWEEVPVLLLEVRDEHVGGLVEISYDYQAQTDKRSEAMRCRCTPDCTGWLVKYVQPQSKKKRS
ncbi:hypothetical protein HYH02_015039 [Chlamydomonas schloesseri]|uniref:Uncharacterized protein n=1 Tax=Chlamydomonas schloesseri TaxID=2026947 RepID=A0A835SDD2_9CHLO|nr:hypothetical protein HYH02_015039 [Chlamydomonas schloesseri]|eukprot:KAG2425212.1 hypothetical protein HYH02_015039 [Chlamydomonas schloesseri]